jgi:iron complex outermembrane receptor protein
MKLKLLCIISAILLFSSMGIAQTGSIIGVVTDKSNGESLPGVNITIVGTTMGSASNIDGFYEIRNVPPGNYRVAAEFIGYKTDTLDAVVTAGQTTRLNFSLEEAAIELGNMVVVTASRRAEKSLDAPASISVVTEADIRGEIAPTSVAILRNVTGVDMAQTGVDRQEVVLRGFNNAFSGAAFILTDFRQAAVPSLGVNIHSIMPNITVDLDKVEVVRGPGAALYGPGVDAGVIHYITKDPFQYPGTTIAIGGGERSLGFTQFRTAGVSQLNQKLAYKFSGQYSTADDWELDPNDPEDAVELQGSVRPRDYNYQKINLNALLKYRFNNQVSLTANAGYSALDGTVQSGIGTVRAEDFGYTYWQARLQAGRFFAQIYRNINSAGNSYVYGTGQNVVDRSKQFNAQAQYDFDMANDNVNVILGADYDKTTPETGGTINGRNEDNDEVIEFGAYAQSQVKLGSKLDLTVALRGDINNIFEEWEVSPRAALVYKASNTNSFRATYNRAITLPGNNSLNLDIVAGKVGGLITVRGRGARDGFTWQRNPAFAAFAGTDLIARSLNPATLGAATPVGLPLDATYRSVYQGIASLPLPTLQGILAQNGINLDLQTLGLLVALLSPTQVDPNLPTTNVTGFSRGVLGIPNPTTGEVSIVKDLADIQPLKNTETQSVEVGYKGIFGNKFLVALDGYYTKKKNFIGPLLVETPFVLVPTLAQDLQAAMAAGIANNAVLAGALSNFGLTPEQVAGLLTNLASGSLPSPETPVAIVVPKENDLGVGQVPELMLTYRNFGQVEYWGVDATFQFLYSQNLNFFGNVSVVSDNFFDNTELDETNTDLALALNAPKLKAKGGFSYQKPKGISFGASGRYVQGFPVMSGPYVGGRPAPFNDSRKGVEDYFLLDVNIGYDLYSITKGLRIDLNVLNALDNMHREFVGAPKIGRMSMVRLNYSF